MWSARLTAPSEEVVADVGLSAQEARHSRRRERNPGAQKGRDRNSQFGKCRTQSASFLMLALRCRRRLAHDKPARRSSSLRSDRRLICRHLWRSAQLQLFRATPIIGTDTEFSCMPRSYGGGTNVHIRAQAVLQTTAEPTTANITRQVSDGTPIFDSPWVA